MSGRLDKLERENGGLRSEEGSERGVAGGRSCYLRKRLRERWEVRYDLGGSHVWDVKIFWVMEH